MKPTHCLRVKMLLGIVSALLLAFVLQPAAALAEDSWTVDYVAAEAGTVTFWDMTTGTLKSAAQETVVDGASPTIGDSYVSVSGSHLSVSGSSSLYETAYWTTNVDVTIPDTTGDRVIKAGNSITTSELQSIEVHQNMTFKILAWSPYESSFAACAVYYSTDGDGVIDIQDGKEDVISGNVVGVTAADIRPGSGSELAYWTADVPVFVFDNEQHNPWGGGKWVAAGTQLTTDQIMLTTVRENTNLTAHFKSTQQTFTFTYTTDGNGTVDPTSEQVVEGMRPASVPTPSPATNYEFDYWTADVAVVSDGTSYAKDDHLTTDVVKQVKAESNVTFTAHFKEASVDPEPEPVDPDDPDGGDTIKPADGEGGKLVPKTGDTLPGVTAAVALGAGVVVAGVALLKKRYQ